MVFLNGILLICIKLNKKKALESTTFLNTIFYFYNNKCFSQF